MIIKQLLEQVLNDVLNQESIDSLSASLEESFAQMATENRDAVRVEMAAQFAADREALVESIDTMVKELVSEHIEELKEDISDFRDLEVEHAEKLVEARKEMAMNLEKDMANLIESLDQFVEARLTEEFIELKESIDEQRKNQLGLRMFEMFRPEVEKLLDVEHGNEVVRQQLEESNKKLEAANKKLEESAQALAGAERAKKMTDVLSSLHGRPREIMEAVLINVPTEKLDEAYTNFIPRILNESVTKNSEKDSSALEAKGGTEVLAEGKKGQEETTVTEGVVISGDDEEGVKNLQESLELEQHAAKKTVVNDVDRDRLRRLAGLV